MYGKGQIDARNGIWPQKTKWLKIRERPLKGENKKKTLSTKRWVRQKKTFKDFFSPKNFSMLTQNFKKITPYEVLLIFLVGCDVMCEQKWAPSLKILYSFFCYNSFSHLNARLNFAEKIFDKKFIGYDPPSLFFFSDIRNLSWVFNYPFSETPCLLGLHFFLFRTRLEGQKNQEGHKNC